MHLTRKTSRRLLGSLVLACAAMGGPAPARGEEMPEPPPVVWEEWSDQLFARARQEQKGVLLTLVTPWCKPCATADVEVYADPVVRHLISRLWIPVRIDSLERPDLDARYRLALWVLSQQAGYPVTAFLFPSGEAIWVDRFIAAEDRETHPGLRSLLARLDRLWKTEFQEARQNALAVQSVFDKEADEDGEAALDSLLVSSITDSVIARSDPQSGGYGTPPRRQNPFAAELVLLASRRRGDAGLQAQALQALRAPVRGAIFDRIGGGFHMAAADSAWNVPVFEKMLSVNAVYLHALTEAVRATGDEELAAAAGKTVDYMLGTLGRKPGVFLAMQAPAAQGEEDASYYAWTVEELRAALAPDALAWAAALLGYQESGEMLLGYPPRVTLKSRPVGGAALAAAGLDPSQAVSREAELMRVLERLRAAKSPPPLLEKEYLDGTAMACSALIQASVVLGREEAAGAALAALDRILAAHSVKNGVPHRLDDPSKSPILMADQAWLGNALIDAHEYSGEARYLAAAVQTSRTLLDLFDAADGAFYDVVEQKDSAGYVRLRRKPFLDTVQPSPQVMAGRLLERIGYHTGDKALIERAAKAYLWSARRLSGNDLAGSSLALAVDAMLNGPIRIHVGGAGDGAAAMRRTALKIYEPARVILGGSAGGPDAGGISICLEEACREGLSAQGELEGALAALRAEARARSRLAPRAGS